MKNLELRQAQGPQGPIGYKGEPGAIGIAGGSIGHTGAIVDPRGEVGPRGPVGPPGAIGIPSGQLEAEIGRAAYRFGIKKEDILIGYRKTPPDVGGYGLYIYYNGGGAEFWKRYGEKWVNWSYLE